MGRSGDPDPGLVSLVGLILCRVMLRMLLGMSIGVAVGCGASAAPAGQAPLANAGGASAAPASPCELGWLERAERLVVTERADGHSGVFELRAELGVRAGTLAGTAKARYRRYPNTPWHSMSVNLQIPRPQVAAVLAGIARGAREPEPRTPGRRVIVTDAGESRAIKLEAAAWLGGVTHRVLLEAEGGRDPHSWSLAGCERELSFEAQVLVTKEYAKLVQLIRRDHVQASLWKRTP